MKHKRISSISTCCTNTRRSECLQTWVRTTFSTDHLSHGVPERKEQRKRDECTAFSTWPPQILMCISNAFGRLFLSLSCPLFFCFLPYFILLLLSSLPFSLVLLSFSSSSFFLFPSFIFLLCFLYPFLHSSFNFSLFFYSVVMSSLINIALFFSSFFFLFLLFLPSFSLSPFYYLAAVINV